MKRKWKIIKCCLFGSIISLPLLGNIFFSLFNIRLDVDLKGYYDSKKVPKLEAECFIDGEYQTKFETWFNETFIPRGIFIKTYNQIQYSFFKLGNRIVGNNGNIFEQDYINDVLCLNNVNDYSKDENRDKMKSYIHDLQEVDRKLKKIGKKLLVYTTPNKAQYFYEDIPMNYRVLYNENKVRCFTYFKTLMAGTDILYLDTNNYVSSEYPVFYKTGIHWSRTLEQMATWNIINALQKESGLPIRNIVLENVEESDIPFWRETDVWDLLNLWENYDEKFYQYQMKREYPEQYQKLSALIQGGSFADGLRHDIMEIYPTEEIYYINYSNWIQNFNGEYTTFQLWNELDLDNYLDRVDFVIVEVNEAVLHNYSNGFVEYLNDYLDSYLPNHYDDERVEKIDIANKPNFDIKGAIRGFWDMEESIIWSKGVSLIKLQNENLTKSGLEIDLILPEELFYKKEEVSLYIYVNGKKVYKEDFRKKIEKKIYIEPNILCEIGEKGEYDVEIMCNESFFPNKIGISEDSRELSFEIKYIGDKKYGF